MSTRPNTAPPHLVYHDDVHGFSLTWTGHEDAPVERHEGGYNEPVSATYDAWEVIRRVQTGPFDSASATGLNTVQRYLDALARLARDIADPEGLTRLDSGPHFPDVVVPLTGEDGNVFAIIGRVREALRRAGHGGHQSEFVQDMMNAESYDEALAKVQRWVEVE